MRFAAELARQLLQPHVAYQRFPLWSAGSLWGCAANSGSTQTNSCFFSVYFAAITRPVYNVVYPFEQLRLRPHCTPTAPASSAMHTAQAASCTSPRKMSQQ